MIEREIAEFGRRMGMPAFSLSPAGLAALDVERLGRLHLELAENAGERELLVYLARAVPEYDVKAPRRVLERCHYRHADPMPLSGGVHKGNIVLLPRFPERHGIGVPVLAALEHAAWGFQDVYKRQAQQDADERGHDDGRHRQHEHRIERFHGVIDGG